MRDYTVGDILTWQYKSFYRVERVLNERDSEVLYELLILNGTYKNVPIFLYERHFNNYELIKTNNKIGGILYG